MTFPSHYLLSFGGDFLSDPGEVWNNNIRLAQDDNLDGTGLASYTGPEQVARLDELTVKIQTHMANISSGYSVNTRLKFVKFNKIDGFGRYESPTTAYTKFTTPITAGAGSSELPITAALAVTWLTSAARGPASRGRVFVPQPAFRINNDRYRLTPTQATACVAAWKTFLQDISVRGPLKSIVPSVVSNKGTGTFKTIDKVQVGDFIDHMSSRRNRTTEVRVTSAAFG